MRNFKRFLAMALSVLMVAGSFAAVSAKEFTDVEADTDYAAAISKLTDLGVIQGYSDDTYKPETELTRWHMALFLARLDSGRIEAEDTLRLWYETTNYTPFKDIAGDYPVAAINYVYNYDMIRGTSDTTFAPEAGISYQDALTMVVRALGYGSDAMDAGYPWKYINKANELGLTDGVDAAVLYTDTLNRGEMAQVLYNALYAVNANGATYAEKYMGQTTVMITGSINYQIAAVEPVRIANYVSVNVMNANGTINTDVTYFLPASEFAAVEDPKALVGMTFRVNTSDNFVTIDVAEPCEYAEFGVEDFEGYVGTNGAASTKLTIDSEDYKIVDSYSFLYNSQTTSSVGTSKDGSNEIMLFAYYATTTDTSNEFQYDANYNILDAKGEIVAYYVPAITGSYEAPYAAKLADGVYLPFVGGVTVTVDETGEEIITTYTWADEIKAVMNGNEYTKTAAAYMALSASNFITVSDRFASIKAYDDDADGLYERAFYNYWAFGKVSADDKGNKYVGGKKITEFNGLTVNADDYVRYQYDAKNGTTVDKVYAWADAGKVIGVNGNNITTTVGNYTISGISNYPGSSDYLTSMVYKLFGYNVSVITETDSTGAEKVLVIKKTSTSTKNVIFDQIISINTNGNVKALVYDLTSGAKSIVDVATVYGYEYTEFKTLLGLFNYYADLASGDVWNITTDAITGLVHFNSITAGQKTVGENGGALSFTCVEYVNPADGKTYEIDAHTASGSIENKKLGNAGTDIIVRFYDKNTDSYQYAVKKGAHLSVVNALAGSTYYVGYCKTNAADDTIDYIYIDLADGDKLVYDRNGKLDAEDSLYGNANINSTVFVYVGANTAVKVSTDGILGQVYTYTNLYCSNGTTVNTVVYNYRLEVGHIYAMAMSKDNNGNNGYIEYEVAVPAYDSATLLPVTATDAAKVFVIDADGNVVVGNKGYTSDYAFLGNFVWADHVAAAEKADKEAKEEQDKLDKEAADKEAADKAAAALEAAWSKLFWALENANSKFADEYMAIAMETLEAAGITDAEKILEAKEVMTAYIAKRTLGVADIKALAAYMPTTAKADAAERALEIDVYACGLSERFYLNRKIEYLKNALEFYALADAKAEISNEGLGYAEDGMITVATRVDHINSYLASKA